MALRDTTVAIFFDVDGEKQVRDLDEEIERTAGSAQEMGDEAEEAGGEMEQAGERGERAFQDTAASLGDLEGQLQTIGTVSGGLFAGVAAAQTFAVTQRAQLEEAETRVSALGGRLGDELVTQAERVSQITDDYVSAEQALRGQAELLSRGIPVQTIEQVTPALATIATTMEDDLMTVFDRFGDPLKEAVGGFEEIINAGPISKEVFLEQAQALGLNVNTLQDFNDEMDESIARQALANAIRIEANNRRRAAAEIQGTVTGRTQAANNAFQRFAGLLGRDVSEAYKRSTEAGRSWLSSLSEQNPETVTAAGNMASLAGISAAVVSIIAYLPSAIGSVTTALGAVSGVSLGWAAALFLLIPAAADLISWLITGKPLLVDWGGLFQDLDEWTGGWLTTLDRLLSLDFLPLETVASFFSTGLGESVFQGMLSFATDGASDGTSTAASKTIRSIQQRESVSRSTETREILQETSGDVGLGGSPTFNITVEDRSNGQRTPEESRSLAEDLADELEDRWGSSLAGAF